MAVARVSVARCLIFLVALSALLFIFQAHEESKYAQGLRRRQDDPATTSKSTTTTPADVTSSSTQPSSSSSSETSSSSTPSSSTTLPSSSEITSSSTSEAVTSQSSSQSTSAETTPTTTQSSSATTAPSDPTTSNPPAQTSQPLTSVLTTRTNAQGITVIDTVVVTASASRTSSSASASSTKDSDNGDSKKSKTSTIVGLSVAGAVALFGIIGFFIWKFTRKRASDDDFNDNEAIKWPDLERNHAAEDTSKNIGGDNLPAPGFSDVPSRSPSRADGYANTVGTASVSDFHGGYADPYAVPPLPHMNPNQPYRDDPGGAYYDPYTGPVPQALMEPEAIPMNQLDPIRTRTPAPGMSVDYNPTGRVGSPGPAMMRAASPGPQAAYGGGYGARSVSPGPQAAYAYPARTASPGPQQGGYGGGY